MIYQVIFNKQHMIYIYMLTSPHTGSAAVRGPLAPLPWTPPCPLLSCLQWSEEETGRKRMCWRMPCQLIAETTTSQPLDNIMCSTQITKHSTTYVHYHSSHPSCPSLPHTTPHLLFLPSTPLLLSSLFSSFQPCPPPNCPHSSHHSKSPKPTRLSSISMIFLFKLSFSIFSMATSADLFSSSVITSACSVHVHTQQVTNIHNTTCMCSHIRMYLMYVTYSIYILYICTYIHTHVLNVYACI